MANTVLGTHGSGTHAARPAGNAVPDGSLYSCSTHSLIYVSSYGGNSWSTWASLGGTGLSDPMTTRGDIIIRDASNTTARLGIGSSGKVLTSDGTDISWQTPSAGGDYTRLAESVAGVGGSASFDFTSISGSYRHLVLECVLRSEKSAVAENTILRINNDSGSNYDLTQGYAFGTTHGAQDDVAQTTWGLECPAASQAAGIFAFAHIIIPYYASSVIQKIARIEFAEVIANSGGNRTTRHMIGAWRSTAAITRITFSFAANDLAEGSAVSLYGVA